MKSIFTDKQTEPSTTDLEKALGNTYSMWQELAAIRERNVPECS